MRVVLCIAMVVFGAFIVVGCATQEPAVFLKSDFSGSVPLTYAVISLVDGNDEKYRSEFPQASLIVASALETALMKTGLQLVVVGKEDVSLIGIVSSYYRGSFLCQNTTVALSIKAVEKKTGSVLWTASYAKTKKWHYSYEPAILAQEVTNELVKKLVNTGKLHQ